MKKHIFSILLISALLSPAAFAYISGKEIKEEASILCPTELNCTSTSPESCSFKSDPQFWEVGGWSGKISPGQYYLTEANAPYHYGGFASASCRYHTYPSTDIVLSAKPESNLEAYTLKGSKWTIYDSVGLARCYSSDASLCPLKEKSAVLIRNVDIHEGIFAFINGTRISDKSLGGYTNIMFDDAIVGCSSVKICKIDIVSSKGAIYGSISVDMDNKLKITEVTMLYPSEVVINRIGSFNAVEIKYSI